MVLRTRTLVLFGLISVLCYTWKLFLPRHHNNIVYSNAMVISRNDWDQVKKSHEILHDAEIEKERVMTKSLTSCASAVEEVETSTTAGITVTTSSVEEIPFSPTATYTPHIVALASTSQAASNEVAESREQFPSEQMQSPNPINKKQTKTPTQGVKQAFNPMIKDNFPLALNAHSAADLPPVPPWNKPPTPHVEEKTPLFIAFTRNWPLLQQTVVSWITSGWPAEDIYVIENTGSMKSNELGRLTLQNPFFLNHTRLHMLGVNVIVTPTLYTFAQLQNFFLWTAIEKDLETYFWSHMDIIPITSEEDISSSDHYAGHKTIYLHAVEVLRSAQSSGPDPNSSDRNKPWAMRFFAFDYLTLVNRAAFETIGGFDTTIPFYHTDCDMYDRLNMAGYEMNEPRHLMTTVGNEFDALDREGHGFIYDVANSVDDLIVLYRLKNTVEASFTDQNRPEDLEAARKHNEEELQMEKQAEDEKEARRKAAENQKQAVLDDDIAQAHVKEMQEQVRAQALKQQATLDDKAEEIKKQEEIRASNKGHIMYHPKVDFGSGEGIGNNNPEMMKLLGKQQRWRQTKDKEENESSSGRTEDPSQLNASIISSTSGEHKKRDLDYSKNPQFKSLEELHRDASSKPNPKKFSSSTSSSTKSNLHSSHKWQIDDPGSPAYFQLLQIASTMVSAKYSQGGDGRNTWQHQQSGGQGEPYYRNPDGFEKAIQMTITLGRGVYLEKWGTLKCGLIENGVTMEDEWKSREWNEQ